MLNVREGDYIRVKDISGADFPPNRTIYRIKALTFPNAVIEVPYQIPRGITAATGYGSGATARLQRIPSGDDNRVQLVFYDDVPIELLEQLHPLELLALEAKE